MSSIEESRKQRRDVAFGIDTAYDRDKTTLYDARYNHGDTEEQNRRDQIASFWREMEKKVGKIAAHFESGYI